VAPVRAALLGVKGVVRARVTLEGHEAAVTYDPKSCSVDDMIKAVGKATGPMMEFQYSAKVKEPAKPKADSN
jgi:copper chaperone CopZ